jgi:hypothetical protein
VRPDPDWRGPLFVLDDGRPLPDSPVSTRLREVLGAALDADSHAGPRSRVALPGGGLWASITRLLALAGAHRDFLLTGAGTAIAETASLLEHAGRRARVHPSAVTYDDGEA